MQKRWISCGCPFDVDVSCVAHATGFLWCSVNPDYMA